MPQLRPGDLFIGKYRITGVLGEGAMGTVLAAQHVSTGERVAIKCLLPVHRENPAIIARFRREAQATVRLKSEHVARIFDHGDIADPGGGPPTFYLVMEHFEGCDLRSYLEQRGPLPVHRATRYVSQACLGLAEAHALGIVHRDLKPANLFRTKRDGSALIKVLDFGVAKFGSPNACGDRLDMTEHAETIGSLRYMAPEQMLDARSVDGRADIWALGVILYVLLSGARPFEGDVVTDLAYAVLVGAPRPLRDAAPQVPAELEAVVMRCLEKRREDRYSSMVELARALAPFTQRPQSTAREPSQRAAPLSAAMLELAKQTIRLPVETEDDSEGPATTRHITVLV